MLALDIGGTNVRYGIISDDKIISTENVYATPRDCGEFLDSLIKTINAFPHESYIVLGIPGTVNRKDGTIDRAPNIPLEPNFSLSTYLASRFPSRVFALYNDADLIALGEYGETTPHLDDPFIILTLGTGIGSGIIIHKELLHGNHGYGSEAGHIVINFQDDARVCSCGKKGCAEAYFSAKAFCEEHRLLTGISVENAENALNYLHQFAPESIEQALNAFAASVAGLINVFHPSHVRYYGGLSSFVTANHDILLNKIQSHLFSESIHSIDFSHSSLKESAYLYGAYYACKGILDQ